MEVSMQMTYIDPFIMMEYAWKSLVQFSRTCAYLNWLVYRYWHCMFYCISSRIWYNTWKLLITSIDLVSINVDCQEFDLRALTVVWRRVSTTCRYLLWFVVLSFYPIFVVCFGLLFGNQMECNVIILVSSDGFLCIYLLWPRIYCEMHFIAYLWWEWRQWLYHSEDIDYFGGRPV